MYVRARIRKTLPNTPLHVSLFPQMFRHQLPSQAIIWLIRVILFSGDDRGHLGKKTNSWAFLAIKKLGNISE